MSLISRLDGSFEAITRRMRGVPKQSVQIALPKLRLAEQALVPDLLSADSVVYSVGLGERARFERALIEHFGCTVHAFDPEPRERDAADRTLPPRLRLHEPTLVGLVDCMQRLMYELGHTYVDLLRLDLKGTEYAVIDALVDSDLRPGQLLVGFSHHLAHVSLGQTERALAQLNELGYRVFDCQRSGLLYSLALV